MSTTAVGFAQAVGCRNQSRAMCVKPSDGGPVDLDVPVALYGVRRPQAGSEVPETGDAETRDADAAENE